MSHHHSCQVPFLTAIAMERLKSITTQLQHCSKLLFGGILKFLLHAIFTYFEFLCRVLCPSPLKSLSGERILVTGSGNGIGREICLQLARCGARTLICWDLDKKSNDKTVQDLKFLGVSAHAYTVDISNRTQVDDAASKVKAKVGDVTVVINNAGIMPIRPFLSHSPSELESLYGINVLAQFWILRQFLPQMIATGSGHIVTMCSIGGKLPSPVMAPYFGTKHAVHGFIESLNLELASLSAKPDIKFTTVYPYLVQTSWAAHARVRPAVFPLLHVLTPEEVAAKLVNGMRRGYEEVYVPGILKYLVIFGSLLPTKLYLIAMELFGDTLELRNNKN